MLIHCAPKLVGIVPAFLPFAEHEFSMKNDLHKESVCVMDFAGGLERWKRLLSQLLKEPATA